MSWIFRLKLLIFLNVYWIWYFSEPESNYGYKDTASCYGNAETSGEDSSDSNSETSDEKSEEVFVVIILRKCTSSWTIGGERERNNIGWIL